jgi:hypothetical protein
MRLISASISINSRKVKEGKYQQNVPIEEVMRQMNWACQLIWYAFSSSFENTISILHAHKKKNVEVPSFLLLC